MEEVNLDELLPIRKSLSAWNLEEFMDEIIFNIYGKPFLDVRRNKGISHWSQERLIQWISSLKCLGRDSAKLVASIIEECVDGESFPILISLNSKNPFNLSYISLLIINTILHQWSSGSEYVLPDNLPPVPIGVLGGEICDLRRLDPSVARKMIEVNQRCVQTGYGGFYGQLIAIGCTEYRNVEKKWVPFGLPNRKFHLKRRKLPNGYSPRRVLQNPSPSTTLKDATHRYAIMEVEETSTSPPKDLHRPPSNFITPSMISHLLPMSKPSSTITTSPPASVQTSKRDIMIEYVPDPLYDVFQVGRSIYSTNDIVIPGQLHLGEDGVYTGPLSRWACRIVCERLPPFRSFIYAGGFNDAQELRVSGIPYDHITLPTTTESIAFDGFTTFGIRIYQPEVERWVEVSILGNCYTSRRSETDSTHPTHAPAPIIPPSAVGNQLTNGTLIDLYGVIIMFQDPICMSNAQFVDPNDVIQRLNALKPHCPVLINSIQFAYLDAIERSQKVYQKQDAIPFGSNTGGNGGNTTGGTGGANGTINIVSDETPQFFGRLAPIHVPIVDYSHVNEELRSYVYPACGHVYGYHKSLEGKPCPLCRHRGPFVPIAFAFEPTICDQLPTHVFNPCGHVASLQTCQLWGESIPVYCKPIPSNCIGHICPYCTQELHVTIPYSRLLVQSESGVDWCEIAEQENKKMSKVLPPVGMAWDNENFQEELVNCQYDLFLRENQSFYNTLQDATNNQLSTSPLEELTIRRLHFPTYAPQVL